MPAAAPTAKLASVAEVAGTLKQVEAAFTAYSVARNTFINSLSGFLERLDPQNVMLEALMKKDVLAVLCCPLAQDPVPGECVRFLRAKAAKKAWYSISPQPGAKNALRLCPATQASKLQRSRTSPNSRQ
jgi:hypothetical protein